MTYGITQSQYCNINNNDNDDNVRHACEQSGFNSFVVYFNVKTHDIWEGDIENIVSLGLQGACKRRKDMKVDIT